MSSILSDIRAQIRSLLNIQEEEVRFQLEEAETRGSVPEEFSARFDLVALQDPGSVQGREADLDNIGKAYKNWQSSGNPLLLAGETGSGMTSLVNASTTLFPHARIIGQHTPISNRKKLISAVAKCFGCEPTLKLEELAEKIPPAGVDEDGNEVKAVIILENVERLFRRSVNGFHLLEEFLLLLHATKDDIFWVVTINHYAQYYLDRVRDFSRNFPSYLKLAPLETGLIKESILARTKGYELFFLKPSSMTKAMARNLEKAEDVQKQELLQQDFFQQMRAYCDDNISIALTWFMRSVLAVRDKRVILRAYNPRSIGDLSMDDLFTVEAILQHHSLHNHDLRRVLRNSSKSAMIAMENLLERELVRTEKNADGTEVYRIEILHLQRLKTLLRNRFNRKIR